MGLYHILAFTQVEKKQCSVSSKQWVTLVIVNSPSACTLQESETLPLNVYICIAYSSSRKKKLDFLPKTFFFVSIFSSPVYDLTLPNKSKWVSAIILLIFRGITWSNSGTKLRKISLLITMKLSRLDLITLVLISMIRF